MGKIFYERLKDKRRKDYYDMLSEVKMENENCTFKP